MNNTEFLDWLADRLVNVYHESPNADFVQRLREMARPRIIKVALCGQCHSHPCRCQEISDKWWNRGEMGG